MNWTDDLTHFIKLNFRLNKMAQNQVKTKIEKKLCEG